MTTLDTALPSRDAPGARVAGHDDTACPHAPLRSRMFPAGRLCSLRNAMLVWMLPMFLVVAIGSAFVSYWSYSRMVAEFMDDQMARLAQSLATQQAKAGPQAPPLPPIAIERAHEKGHYLVELRDGRGELLWTTTPALAAGAQPLGLHELRLRNADWVVYATPLLGTPGTVQVFQSAEFRTHLNAGRALAAIVPVLLLLPLAFFALWMVSGAMSRAVQEIGRQAAAQDEHSIAELPLARVPSELRPMVEAFNSLLTRLRNAFTSQRRLVQDAAHELRTPITAVALQLENVRRDMPPGACQQSFAQLETGVRRAQRLVDQLMKLSHQQQAVAEPPTTVDLQAQARESIAALLPLADQRGIDLGATGRLDDAAGPSLRCAAADFRAVLDNLLENAVRYTPAGGVVDLHLGGSGKRWYVEVVDTGPGIAPEHLPRVFDRFFRVPGSAPGGSGLGLAIAWEAATRCGLRLSIRNREDSRGLVARIEPA